ncbi:hypothetical protein DYBT9275_01045 [Dyadobacter sp. CECT 9275]|uniref:Uncharacterized protein n=2 Tax=Dyadobacter helix TaxID=2822344 RepID=A0A916NK47_9BACT|nr:hypothetical protein DYBT9275_01045 [Dyadobacter sp. CECT 9275]
MMSFASHHVYAQDNVSATCTNPAGGCDTIAIEKKVSPWRIGGFLGPAFAFCGSWENTFNSNKYRDKSRFNGVGYNALLNADYFFKNKKENNRFQFGVGGVAGLQTFFLRKDLDTFLERIIASEGYSQAVIKKGASEDHYLAVGPVLNFNFTGKPRSPYLEASVRGGIFRTTPAAIFVYDRVTGNNIYSVTASEKRYHAGLLATLGFFVPSKNGLWAWGVEAIGFRTKVNYIFPGATIYPFERKHGGFSGGIAMRRKFIRDVPVKKEPTPALICVAPDLDIKMGQTSMKGMIYNPLRDTTQADTIKITWKSNSVLDSTKTETFTARIHQLNGGMDKVIGQVVCQKQNEMLWPAEYLNRFGRPLDGQYYVTVQSNQTSACASCVSEASTTGFSVVIPDTVQIAKEICFKQCYLEVYAYKMISSKRVVYGKSPTTCVGCICPVDTVTKKVPKYYLLGTVKLDHCEASALNLNDEIAKGNIKIPAWAKTVYTAVESTVIGNNCNEPQGKTKKNYKAAVRKGKAGTFEPVQQKK